MSKAFTREDDADQQGDLLPERAISPHPNLVTAGGLAQIDDAVTRLTGGLSAAKAAGDATTTASTARDLRYWSARRATAQLTEPRPGSQVQFGSHVTIRRPDGSSRAYRIVGTDEANPKEGTLSYVSPLAQALMGKDLGLRLWWVPTRKKSSLLREAAKPGRVWSRGSLHCYRRTRKRVMRALCGRTQAVEHASSGNSVSE